MDRCEDIFTSRENDLSDFSSLAEPEAVDSQSSLHADEINPSRDSNNDLAPRNNTRAIPVTAESALIAEAKQMRLDKFYSDKFYASTASTSTSPEYAHMVLGHPFKVSRCGTIQALKSSAHVKCIHYNTTTMLYEALIHNTTNFTVDNIAASPAAQREAQRQ